MEQVVVNYLRYLKVPVSAAFCMKLIVSHPDYPSLLSVSDAMERLGIPCRIGRIEEKNLSNIEFPFLIHLEGSREGLVLIKSKNDLSKEHVDLSSWKGVVLKADPVQVIKDSEHNRELRKEHLRRRLAVVCAVSLVAALLTVALHSFSWIQSALLLTSIVGTGLGYVLIAKDLGVTYKPVESFCNTSTRVNCDRILNSDEAQILPFFSLSEAVVSYFVFQMFITGFVLPMQNAPASFLLVLMAGSALAIPVVCYSVYYQAIKAKTWCKLCMLVNGVLVIQALFFGFLAVNGTVSTQDVQLIPFLFSLALFLTVATAVVLIKERFEITNKALQAETEASRIKNDPEVFTTILHRGIKIQAPFLDFQYQMRVGSRKATIKLTMLASFDCTHCGPAYTVVEELVNQYPDDISCLLFFRFSEKSRINHLPASTYVINYWKHFISGGPEEEAQTQNLIRDWYEIGNSEEFFLKYPMDNMSNLFKDRNLEIQFYKLVEYLDIGRSPFFFMNGFPLPETYTINDLRNMASGLVNHYRSVQAGGEKELVL